MKVLNTGIILFLILTMSSCAIAWLGAGAGIGIAGYKYINGDLEVTYNNSLNKVYMASKKALHDLKIEIIKEYKDPIEAKIEGNRLNGEKVTIKIKNYEYNKVVVTIRVGLLGDREVSSLIKDKINYYLKLL